jgi:hypothetical protein
MPAAAVAGSLRSAAAAAAFAHPGEEKLASAATCNLGSAQKSGCGGFDMQHLTRRRKI